MTSEQTNTDFNFWKDHSLKFLEMALRHDFRERIAHPDGYGKRTGECGDTVEFFLVVSDGRLDTISYDIDGCANTNACANTIVEIASGTAVSDAWHLTDQTVIDYLETLPENDTHCAELAIGAFYLALKDLDNGK